MKNHDPEIKTIFTKYYSYLVAFATTIVKCKEDAEDIVIQAFSRFIPKYKYFESDEKIKSYLFISVKNDCLNHLKLNSIHDRIKNNICNTLSESDEFNFHESMSEITMIIFMEAEKLPKQCKDVFYLSFKNGLTGKEIAKILNVTTSTVFNQRARAISFLKRKLNPS